MLSTMAATLITLLVMLELGFVGLCLAWGPAEHRRPRFWRRVALTCLGIPAFVAVVVAAHQLNVLSDDADSKLLPSLLLIGIGVLICVPSLFYRKPGSSPDSSASDSDGGLDPRPGSSPDPSRGGRRFLDADQVRARARPPDTEIRGPEAATIRARA